MDYEISFIPKAESFFTLVEEGVPESKGLGTTPCLSAPSSASLGSLENMRPQSGGNTSARAQGAPEGGCPPRYQLVCDAHRNPESEKDNGRLKSKILKTLA